MPLVCADLLPSELSALNASVARLSDTHPLRKECVDGDVRVFRYENNLILHSAGGFYFEHMMPPYDIATTLVHHIRAPRTYHCTAFEVDHDDPSVIYKLLDRFQEQHGLKMRNMIDWCVIKYQGRDLMLCKLPACILRHMLAPTGGLMRTNYSGPLVSLQNIPTLVKLGVLSQHELHAGDCVQSVLATEYREMHYEAVKRLHWDIVREVIARPHSGITLGPVAMWDA